MIPRKKRIAILITIITIIILLAIGGVAFLYIKTAMATLVRGLQCIFVPVGVNVIYNRASEERRFITFCFEVR